MNDTERHGYRIKLVKSFRYWGKIFRRKIRQISMSEYTLFSIYAIIIGAIAGLAAVIFHNSIEFFNELFFEQTTEGLFFLGAAAVIVLPALGMLIQSIMIYTSPSTAKKRGVGEVIKAVAMRGGYIPFRTTLFHFIAPVICIGSGSTVGPEGPAAQLGGGLASKFGNLIGLSDSRRRMFTAAGSGAAIAAIFNTPLGGVFFALEIILLNDFQTAVFSALILSSVTASAISRIFLGNVSIFTFNLPEIGAYQYFYLYIILGVLSGLLSLLFIRYSSSVSTFLKKKVLSNLPRWIIMTAVGLIVGVSGFFYKDIFGIGYDGINHILSNSLAWQLVLILFALKFILVPMVLHSGGFGGLFAPSLFMGACFGYLYATALNYFFGINVDTTTYILVGMGTFLGGINSIPISAILIIFEMTKNYSFILPLMLAVVISTTIVQLVLKDSVHVKHLEQQGYRISHGRDVSILKSIQVSEIMNKDVVLIPEDTPLNILIGEFIDSKHTTFYTINNSRRLSGTITESELRPIITEYEHIREVLVASDIANSGVTTVYDTDDLDHLMKLFEQKKVDELPVVSINDPSNVIGYVSRQDVIATYNRESLKFNLADGFASELKKVDENYKSKVADDYSIIEKKVPDSFVGKTLAELQLRNKYGVQVLMIKQMKSPFAEDERVNEFIVPDPTYVIQTDDTLVLFGRDDQVVKI